MGAMLLAFLVEVSLITYRDVSGKDPTHTVAGLPVPADYLAAIAVFGALGLVPKDSPARNVAALTGWALVIVTYLNLAPSILPATGKTAAPAPSPSPAKTKGTIA